MFMTTDGQSFNVDWYFVPPGTPVFPFKTCGSNNNVRPDIYNGPVREDPAAPRPWRNGSIPDYVGADARPGGAHPVNGLESWFADGAPPQTIVGIRYDGSRGFDGSSGPGIFPPIKPALPAPVLVSSTRGTAHPILDTVGSQWTFGWSSRPLLEVFWELMDGTRLFKCFPHIAALLTSEPLFTGVFLKCDTFDPVTGISTWTDPTNAHLDAGEVLTLYGLAPLGDDDLMLLEQHTASNSPSLDFTSSLSSTFDDYELQLLNVVPATDNVELWVRASMNGGSTYDASNVYKVGQIYWSPTGQAEEGFALGGAWRLTGSARKVSSIPGNGGLSMSLRLVLPAAPTMPKQLRGEGSHYSVLDSQTLGVSMYGEYTPSGVVNALRVMASSGNLTSGIARLYGLRKS